MTGIGGCGDTLFSDKKNHMSSLRTTCWPQFVGLDKFLGCIILIYQIYQTQTIIIIIDAGNMNQTNNAGGHHTVDLGCVI